MIINSYFLSCNNLLSQIGIRLEFKGVEHGPLSFAHFLCHGTPVYGRLSDSFRRHYSRFQIIRSEKTETKPAETREFSRLAENGGCSSGWQQCASGAFIVKKSLYF